VVEAAIWNRGRDREQNASKQNERSILVEGSQTGFTRPQGALRAANDRQIQETQGKVIELSREIMITQAQLEQENIKTSIQQTIMLEDILMREHNNLNNRALDAAKFMQTVAIQIFNASIAYYNMQLEAYKTAASVFNSLIQAELVKIEIYKAEIEAQGLIVDINKTNAEIYAIQIAAIKTAVEIYEIEVRAVGEELRAEGLKIEAYGKDVDAYSALIDANTQHYIAYGEAMKGEAIKADINKTMVDGYASKVQAYATEQDAYDNQARIGIDTERLKIDQFDANMRGFTAQVDADSKNFSAQADIYDQSQFQYNKSIELMKIDIANVLSNNELHLKAYESSGAIHGQIAATALNGISVSASNSSSLGNSLSERISE